jgi:hypothetical protein
MSPSVHRLLRLLGALAAGYAVIPLALFALYWGGSFVVGDIPSDAVAQWVVGASFVVVALLVLWKTRPAAAGARSPGRGRRGTLTRPAAPFRPVEAPPRT